MNVLVTIDRVLYPIYRGILEFIGFQVLPPFVAYGPGRVDRAQRQAVLDALQDRIAALADATVANHQGAQSPRHWRDVGAGPT